MKVVITEEQYKRVLTESIKSEIEDRLSSAYEFAKDVISGAQEQLNISFRFLLTYGAGIGSVIRPITEYLNGKYSGLSETEIQGLVIAAVSIVFFNAKDYLKIYKKNKEQGTLEELSDAVTYTQKLKDRLSRILDVLGVSVYTGLDIIAYSFLLPILPAILNVLQNPEMDMVALEGLLSSSFITASAVVLKKIIEKLSEKISSKNSSDDEGDDSEGFPTLESDIV